MDGCLATVVKDILFSRLILIQFGFILYNLVSCKDTTETRHDMFYDGMEVKKGSDILAVNLKVEKIDDIQFKVNGFIEHFQEFNSDWSMYVRVFRSDTANGEYELIAQLPGARTDLCAILRKEYKNLVYDSLKDYSNAPHYETCPLKAARYDIKDYPFDGAIFDKFFTKGYYLLSAFWSYKEEADVIQYDIYLHVEDK